MDNLDEELKKLKNKLKEAWCKETSYYPEEWSEKNPSCGQCMITTRYLVDHFGARAFFAHVLLPDGTEAPGGHFFAKINGKRVDLTEDQFPSGKHIIECREVSPKFLLRKPDARRRYDLMTARLEGARFDS